MARCDRERGLDGFGINNATVNKGVDREIARVRKVMG